MKTKISFLSLLLFLSPTLLQSQVSDTVKRFVYNDDLILKKIVNALPAGWTFKSNDTTFIISRIDSVIISDRKSLHIIGGQKMPMDSIVKYGHKGKSELIYRHEPRWTEEQKMNAKSNNIEINQQLSNLPVKER